MDSHVASDLEMPQCFPMGTLFFRTGGRSAHRGRGNVSHRRYARGVRAAQGGVRRVNARCLGGCFLVGDLHHD